ncbi:MAG: universal stress protein [Gemmatimonadota bacterium]
MPRSILVLLDGSRFAEYALPTALDLARVAGARLRLLMVHEPAMALVPAANMPVATGRGELELRAEQNTYLANTAFGLGIDGSSPVAYELIDGLAGPAIAEAITTRSPDLIVMSTHGRGALSRFWLGSVADYLIRHVSVPILLLRPKDGEEIPAPGLNIQRVLVPVDLSAPSETILDALRPIAQATQAHLTLLHIVEPMLGPAAALPYSTALDPEAIETRRVEAERDLDRLAGELRAVGISVATKVVVGLGIAETVLDISESHRFDLVALSTNGAGGLKRFLLGSVADKVIRGGVKPVLVYRPPEAPARWQL